MSMKQEIPGQQGKGVVVFDVETNWSDDWSTRGGLLATDINSSFYSALSHNCIV